MPVGTATKANSYTPKTDAENPFYHLQKKRDGIITINGTRLAGMNFYDVITKLNRGNAGTSVTVTVERPGSPVPPSFTMVREPVSVQP